MKDPYSVLGVSRTASDDEVKKAYRELVRKYHPDNYHNNPLADLAQEKMKEINEAYAEIERQRSGKGSSSSSYGGSSSGAYRGNTAHGGAGYNGTTDFPRVRSAISAGNLPLAEQLLMSSSNRNAEWHYLMGSLNFSRGWFDEALRYLQTAVNMDPSNPEYAQALAYAQQGGNVYRPSGYSSVPSADFCNTCMTLMCLNALCRCH